MEIEETRTISVLLIEDNPGDQVIINENLREADYNRFSIKNCFSLSEGLQALKNEHYDVILLDLWLPDSSGLDTLVEITNHEKLIPVIVLTIDKSDITGLTAIKYGAQDYLAKDELHYRSLSNSIRYAINRKKLELKLTESLAEKELLMKESNHRIKNNLQLISSFINLQLSNVEDKKAKNILSDSLNRIASISLLHDYLFRSSKLDEVNVQTYLYKIIDHIKATLQTDFLNIKIIKYIDNFVINSGLAISLGLVVNEIITNAVKYAFIDKNGGVISVELKFCEGNILLTVKDDGNGMEENIDFDKASTLGFQILYSLVTQHKGTINYEVDNGTKYRIKIPLKISEAVQ